MDEIRGDFNEHIMQMFTASLDPDANIQFIILTVCQCGWKRLFEPDLKYICEKQHIQYKSTQNVRTPLN